LYIVEFEDNSFAYRYRSPSRGIFEFFKKTVWFSFDFLHATLITITCCFATLRKRLKHSVTRKKMYAQTSGVLFISNDVRRNIL